MLDVNFFDDLRIGLATADDIRAALRLTTSAWAIMVGSLLLVAIIWPG